jgi:acetate kinase
MTNVLAINCGSTSLKFRLVRLNAAAPDGPGEQTVIAAGVINNVGARSEVEFSAESGPELRETRALPNLGEGVRLALGWLTGSVLRQNGQIEAVGHRIVHGGARFTGPTRIDTETLRDIEALEELAPLHNGPALEAIQAVSEALGPAVPAVATFDTTFHQSMPPRARNYALPLDLMEKHGIRRYGFHGLAHRSMVLRYATLTNQPSDRVRLVTLQLGGGCSITAVEGGRSVDTSMGFTPLEGLMMATRSGDLDPSLPLFLAEGEGWSREQIDHLLNARSGLLGVSGRSNDVRVLLQAESEGDDRAGLALDMFCYRVRKAIGGYLAALGGAEAVVFGGGIGEHQPVLRVRICAGLGFCGLTLDEARNSAATGVEARISTDSSSIHAWVIPSDEESMIVSDTISVLARS